MGETARIFPIVLIKNSKTNVKLTGHFGWAAINKIRGGRKKLLGVLVVLGCLTNH